MCSNFTDVKMEKFTNSDTNNTAMLASRTFDFILQQIRTSSLNFQLQLSPFSAQISLKKSLVKERNGSLRLPPTISSLSCKVSQHEELEARADKLEKELKALRREYKQAVDDCEEANQRINTLEDFINKQMKSERNPEVLKNWLTICQTCKMKMTC